jgi:hypothetical protein
MRLLYLNSPCSRRSDWVLSTNASIAKRLRELALSGFSFLADETFGLHFLDDVVGDVGDFAIVVA